MRIIIGRGAALLLAVGACATTHVQASQPVQAAPPPDLDLHRVYTLGETYRYDLQRHYAVNGVVTSVTDASSIHEVVGPPPLRERIRFERLSERKGGNVFDGAAAVATVPPYEVSIADDAPKGSMKLPDISGIDKQMTSWVTDLHTFLVAVFPQAGVRQLHRVGDVHVVPEPKIGDWGNTASASVGQDAIQITYRLVGLTDTTATIETSFEPPAEQRLMLQRPWMERPVVPGTVNNFQQVQKAADGFGAIWGVERFVVKAQVRRSDGRIEHASMDNPLTLRSKGGCDESLTKCAYEAPVTLRRTIEMTLR